MCTSLGTTSRLRASNLFRHVRPRYSILCINPWTWDSKAYTFSSQVQYFVLAYPTNLTTRGLTGASGGIGLDTAKLYCCKSTRLVRFVMPPERSDLPALGAEVTAHYNTQSGRLERLSNANDNLQAVQAELSDETSVTNMFTAIAHAGPVQVLVVNHGIGPTEDVPVADLTLQRWNHTIATNLTSSFLVCREYLKLLRVATPEVKEKAAIVLVGSTAGKYGEVGHADYAVAKSGECLSILCRNLSNRRGRSSSDDVWLDLDAEERDRKDCAEG